MLRPVDVILNCVCGWLLHAARPARPRAEFLIAAKAANLTGVRVYGGDSLTDANLFQTVRGRPSLLPELIATGPSFGTDAFVKSFAKFTNGSAYSAFAAHAYDAMDALLRALKAAPAPSNGSQVIAELQKQSFEGAEADCLRCTACSVGSHGLVAARAAPAMACQWHAPACSPHGCRLRASCPI